MRFPSAIEHEYIVHLRNRCVYLHRMVSSRLLSLLPRADALLGSLYTRAMDAIQDLKKEIENLQKFGVKTIKKIGSQVDYFTSNTLKKFLNLKDLSPMGAPYPLGGWVSENVSLIKTIDTRYINDIEREIAKAYEKGVLEKDLAKIIADRTGVSKTRADRIARDQIGKLNSRMNGYRQQMMGIKRYRWRDRRDNRVRSSHRARNGKIFYWSNPPAHGHPGTEIECRCYAEPVVDYKFSQKFNRKAA